MGFFREIDYDDFEETVFELLFTYIEENVLSLSNPKFYELMNEEFTEFFYEEWVDAGIIEHEEYDELNDIIFEIIKSFLQIFDFVPLRSQSCHNFVIQNEKQIIQKKEKIEILKNTYQPKQKTSEWYEYRHGLMTASNIWKIFSSETQLNSYIYEKCKPYVQYKMNNTGGTLHWGNMYEPISIQLYENLYDTKIGDFGCIQHQKYHFIGASPDGINIDENNKEKYGRLIEVKNIVNREITGIPKEEYWIQVQLQLEICDLYECDFLETRFKNYENEKCFYEDNDREYKGVILNFIEKNLNIESSFLYKYIPIKFEKTQKNIEKWIETTKNELKETHILYEIKFWYLEELSCVLIKRNREWFLKAIIEIENVWNIINKEKKMGFEHRAIKKIKSNSKDYNEVYVSSDHVIHNLPIYNGVCLIKLEN